ncbi:MAG: hypothetical protein OXH96_15040 [Spirochaetaceae bacterium]|nr:hypothetical protein [Spirochaetaceae bacterium]
MAHVDGYRQSGHYPLFDRNDANHGGAKGAAQKDISEPASILHVDRQVQSQHAFQGFPVEGVVILVLHLPEHEIDDVAGDEPNREKDQHGQYEQRGDHQQQTPDDVRSHVTRPVI